MISTGKAAVDSELGAVTRTKWIFVSRFEADTKKEAVEDYLSKMCEGNIIICEDLKTRYPTYNSYKVGFPAQFAKTVMDCEKWPEGILVNKFVAPSRSVQT